MWRGRKCCVNCSALLLSVLGESLLLIVAELGLAFLATCRHSVLQAILTRIDGREFCDDA